MGLILLMFRKRFEIAFSFGRIPERNMAKIDGRVSERSKIKSLFLFSRSGPPREFASSLLERPTNMSVKGTKDSGMEKVPSKTQWDKVRKIQDNEIDYSDNPPLNETFFEEAVVWKGIKKQITLRIDPDVIDFFKKQGKGYQTVINEVLRKYVEAQKKHAV